MTGADIIKGLEHCLGDLDCLKCPYVDYEGEDFCNERLHKDVLTIINRRYREIAILHDHINNKLDVTSMLIYSHNNAKWIISSDGYYPYCSNCKTEPKNGVKSKYCPECGARMDGEK